MWCIWHSWYEKTVSVRAGTCSSSCIVATSISFVFVRALSTSVFNPTGLDSRIDPECRGKDRARSASTLFLLKHTCASKSTRVVTCCVSAPPSKTSGHLPVHSPWLLRLRLITGSYQNIGARKRVESYIIRLERWWWASCRRAFSYRRRVYSETICYVSRDYCFWTSFGVYVHNYDTYK